MSPLAFKYIAMKYDFKTNTVMWYQQNLSVLIHYYLQFYYKANLEYNLYNIFAVLKFLFQMQSKMKYYSPTEHRDAN